LSELIVGLFQAANHNRLNVYLRSFLLNSNNNNNKLTLYLKTDGVANNID
jgi:hypothetical protein